ncbi:MAG TPA: hypothetical protein VFQ54_10170 [Thermomicrobiales bacterium]|nr:hypothetical protein [Thermomicrobiales bacterium]
MAGGTMAGTIRVMLEIGPKGKRAVAVAPDWPGLERGAKTEAEAVDRLLAYVPRYANIARLAGMGDEFGDATSGEVVETYPGVGSTDFWGISFAFSQIDRQEISSDELERQLTLMQACWSFFDDVRSRVSPEMKKGVRGGGRDRDHIVRHTVGEELGWAEKLGIRWPPGVITIDDGLQKHRDSYCAAIRSYHAEGKMARKWPLQYLIRHTAYHTMDHAWEMEDKDLSADLA